MKRGKKSEQLCTVVNYLDYELSKYKKQVKKMCTGDVVKHRRWGDIGLVTQISPSKREIKVLWHCGDHSWTLIQSNEVISECKRSSN